MKRTMNVLAMLTVLTVLVQGTRGDLSLIETGGSFGTDNIAPAGTAFAQDLIDGYSAHTIAHLNDGNYGNDYSWIGMDNAGVSSFAGIDFGGTFTVNSIAWGRDNTAEFTDRFLDTYTVQYTTIASPDASTGDDNWTTIGAVSYTENTPAAPWGRHRWSFDAVDATGIRIVVNSSSTCIDEIEVYAIPEPAVATLIGFAGAGILAGRRFFLM